MNAPIRSTTPDAPIEVPPPSSASSRNTARRVAIVTPCFNAPDDLRILFDDLARLDLALPDATPIDTRLIVVDNASDEPLDTLTPPPNIPTTFLRLRANTGGSGGYNAGMAYALRDQAFSPEFLWLLDSDARPNPDTLRELIDAIDADPAFVAMGSAIARPDDGVVFEIGGRLTPFLGQFAPAYGEDRPPPSEVVEVTYTAACSALVRSDAVRRTGLFREVFLNADDVEWCIRLAQTTNARIGATTRSVVRHPQMKAGITRPRYWIARNAFAPIDALRMGAPVRFLRALREIPRAVAQVMIGRDDLARLHLAGLEDAARGNRTGPGRAFELPVVPMTPIACAASALAPFADELRNARVWVHPKIALAPCERDDLQRALTDAHAQCPPIPEGPYPLEKETFLQGVAAAMLRLAMPLRHRVAILPVRGRPNAWFRGRIQILLAPDAMIITRLSRPRVLTRALATGIRGVLLALRIALRRPRHDPLPSVRDYPIDAQRTTHAGEPAPR